MPGILTSKLTARSQTTLPPGVRKVLGLEPGERLGYIIEGHDVRLVNASAVEDDDPVVANFLAFLERDMTMRPDRLALFPSSLFDRARAVTAGVTIDHDAPIDDVIAI